MPSCAPSAAARDLGRLFCAPGNAGIAEEAELVPLAVDDLEGLVAFVERRESTSPWWGRRRRWWPVWPTTSGSGGSRCSVPGPTAPGWRAPRPSPRR